MIDKLKQYMTDNNINQKQLAGLMGISEAHLSHLLAGNKKPGEKTVEAYFKLPGVKEKEALIMARIKVQDLWTNDNINNATAKLLLKILNPQD